ncbi:MULTISPECIES: DUF1236 domain-containing protein [Microvirga]|uniref:DUF1236 domain-containing protein n=1 Tax=Microvirga TaxID=186650 RepID=UPI001CFFC38E|nr:DUF1236 domain-containing protein [Microvirga lenta]MCB5177454.1 DUF1236 domain-containing protein [Microvirga lenta]
MNRALATAFTMLLLVLPHTGQAQEPQTPAGGSTASDLNKLPQYKRDRIKSYVEAQNIAPVTAGKSLEAGAILPSTIPLRGLPRDMITEIPEVTSYRYVVMDDGIAIVEPSSRRIVQIIR